MLTAPARVVRARTARPLAVSEFEKGARCSVAGATKKIKTYEAEGAKKTVS